MPKRPVKNEEPPYKPKRWRITRLEDKEGNTGYEKHFTASQRAELEEFVFGNGQWTEEFKKLAKKCAKEFGSAPDEGDLEKAERVEAKCLEKLSDKTIEGFTASALKLTEELTLDELHPDDKHLRRHVLILKEYRRACLRLELNPENYFESQALSPLLSDLWGERHSSRRKAGGPEGKRGRHKELVEIWQGCLEHIGKKISQEAWDYPDYDRAVMMSSLYKYLHKEIKKICKSYPGVIGRERREIVSESYLEIREIYDEDRGGFYSLEDSPSFYAKNLIAKWNGIKYRTLMRRLKMAKNHVRYLKTADIYYDLTALDRMGWELVHNQETFNFVMKIGSHHFEKLNNPQG